MRNFENRATTTKTKVTYKDYTSYLQSFTDNKSTGQNIRDNDQESVSSTDSGFSSIGPKGFNDYLEKVGTKRYSPVKVGLNGHGEILKEDKVEKKTVKSEIFIQINTDESTRKPNFKIIETKEVESEEKPGCKRLEFKVGSEQKFLKKPEIKPKSPAILAKVNSFDFNKNGNNKNFTGNCTKPMGNLIKSAVCAPVYVPPPPPTPPSQPINVVTLPKIVPYEPINVPPPPPSFPSQPISMGVPPPPPPPQPTPQMLQSMKKTLSCSNLEKSNVQRMPSNLPPRVSAKDSLIEELKKRSAKRGCTVDEQDCANINSKPDCTNLITLNQNTVAQKIQIPQIDKQPVKPAAVPKFLSGHISPPIVHKNQVVHENNILSNEEAKTKTVVSISDEKEPVLKNDANVKKLVYNTYRGLLGAYHNKANESLATLPKGMVVQHEGVSKQMESLTLHGGLEKLNGRINPNVDIE